MKKTLIAATLGLAFFLPQAEAALFDFSYIASNGTVAGVLDGTLQADHNTVVVNSILDFATFDSGSGPVAGPSLPSILSIEEVLGGTGSPLASLDGSVMDFCAASGISCSPDGFAFDGVVQAYGGPGYISGSSFGGDTEAYNPANWHLSAQSSVPAPATLPLLAIGGAAMAWRRRKAA